MITPMKYLVCLFAAALLLHGSIAEAAKPAGIYQVRSDKMPTKTGGVAQSLATQIPSYRSEGGAGWWFCGHAAMATAINYSRQGSVTTATKITQLQWFHDQLKRYQGNYALDPHRQASIDALLSIIKSEEADEFSVKKITGFGSSGRASVRDQMLETLKDYSSYAVVLSKTTINGVDYGHFYAVYKIDYRPSTSTGGTVYFWDPYRGALGSMDFGRLMDGMRDFGTYNRYSFLRLYKN